MKKCSKCKEVKGVECFGKDKSSKDGLYAYCRFCGCEKAKEWYKNNTEKAKITNKEWKKNNPERVKAINKEWKKNNSEKIKAHVKEWYKNNPEKVLAYSRKWAKNNKTQINAHRTERKKTDINFKLAENLRRRLNSAIKRNQKSGSAVSDLGCTVEELKTHLESHFQSGMTWKNWTLSGWHIDHITPITAFDLTNREQFLKACHYTNLQPLWSVDNFRKGNRIC